MTLPPKMAKGPETDYAGQGNEIVETETYCPALNGSIVSRISGDFASINAASSESPSNNKR